MEVWDVAGGGYERGVQLGRSTGAQISGHVDAWLGSLARVVPGEPRAYVREMLVETDFAAAARMHAPDLMEEVKGLAEGAGLDPDLIFAMQLIDEEWAYRVRRKAATTSRDKCSSIAVVGGPGLTWLGQNMDLGSYTDGHQALLRIAGEDGSPPTLIFTLAGVIALLGVNAAGVGVCVNSLPQLPSAAHGLPVAFVIRKLLTCRTLAEAATMVQALPHATNQHYLIAEPGAARSFEASAAGVTEFRPATADRILHTNHPLTPVQGAPEPAGARDNSEARLAALVRRIEPGEPDLAAIKAALCSCDDPRHPVCRVLDAKVGLINFTCGSMISALRRQNEGVTSWITAGPPTVESYETFSPEKQTVSA